MAETPCTRDGDRTPAVFGGGTGRITEGDLLGGRVGGARLITEFLVSGVTAGV